MKTVFKIIALISFTFLVNSCKKNDTEKIVDIYLGGTSVSAHLSSVFACYWKNGQEFPVSDGTKNARVNSIFVSGGDVYLAGSEDITPYRNRRAAYWKNKTRIYLTSDTNQNSEINSIFIAGNDVYAAGFETTNQGYGAKYWKNGIAVNLTNYTGFAKATSIVVNGTDVYVAGFDSRNGITVAKYWKNGVEINLSNGSADALTSVIAVSGTDVYVAGKEYNSSTLNYVAKYWKNGISVKLTDGTNDADANSMVVIGNDVYISGFEKDGFKNVAKYWKNGAETKLQISVHSESNSHSIAVYGTDVYVTTNDIHPNPPYGNSNSTQYWKNDQKVPFAGIVLEKKMFIAVVGR